VVEESGGTQLADDINCKSNDSKLSSYWKANMLAFSIPIPTFKALSSAKPDLKTKHKNIPKKRRRQNLLALKELQLVALYTHSF